MRSTSIPLDAPESDEIVYESDNLIALYCRASDVQSKQLVVAFHPLQLTHYMDVPRKGQSRETIRAAGLDAIQVVPCGNHWYQYDDIGSMMTKVRAIADRYLEVVAYGQSMGAYGAIHTSALLRPSKLLAICPQFSIDPAKISFDSGYKSFAENITFIRDDIEKNASQDTEFIIAYDPHFPNDHNHYLEYEQHLKKVYKLRMPFCGHDVSEALRKAEMIPDYLIRLIIGGKNEVNATRQKFRRHRHNVPAYWNALRLALAKWQEKNKRIDKASYQAFKVYELNKRFSSLQYFCEIAERLGTPQQAAVRWFFAISIFGEKLPPLAYVRAIKYSLLGGDIDLARITSLSALKKFPNDFGLMREYLDILINESNFSDARLIASELQRIHGAKADDVIRNRKAVLSM